MFNNMINKVHIAFKNCRTHIFPTVYNVFIKINHMLHHIKEIKLFSITEIILDLLASNIKVKTTRQLEDMLGNF